MFHNLRSLTHYRPSVVSIAFLPNLFLSINIPVTREPYVQNRFLFFPLEADIKDFIYVQYELTYNTISITLMGTVQVSEFEPPNLTERRTTVTSVGAGMRGGPLFANLNTNNR
jgi:hypothetical protein